MKNGSWLGQPYASLVSRISSSPSGEPCPSAVSCLCGAPGAMCVRTTMRLGPAAAAPAGDTATAGPPGRGRRGGRGGLEPVQADVLAEVLNVPAVRFEALRGVIGERERCVAL